MYLLLYWVAGAAGSIGKGNYGHKGNTNVCLLCSARASIKEGTKLKSLVTVSHGTECPCDKEGVKWGSPELPWKTRQAFSVVKKRFLDKQQQEQQQQQEQ